MKAWMGSVDSVNGYNPMNGVRSSRKGSNLLLTHLKNIIEKKTRVKLEILS